MDNLESIADKSQKKWSKFNFIYIPLISAYSVGGAFEITQYAISHNLYNPTPSINEQIIMCSMVVGYIAGLPLLSCAFDKATRLIKWKKK